jgi:hypothetical protein
MSGKYFSREEAERALCELAEALDLIAGSAAPDEFARAGLYLHDTQRKIRGMIDGDQIYFQPLIDLVVTLQASNRDDPEPLAADLDRRTRNEKLHGPPRAACYLLDLLLAKADRKTIPGDLVEEFETSILPKYGSTRRARFWFWAQAARAITERNRLSRWVLVYGLGRFCRMDLQGDR